MKISVPGSHVQSYIKHLNTNPSQTLSKIQTAVVNVFKLFLKGHHHL